MARVTGNNISEIKGTLGVEGSADLYFLNANGILLGPNASLDLSGSFIATTANSFTFADGSEFSATNPSVVPLLTVNVQQPIGLRLEEQQGPITNAADLAVASRQTLSLSGSDVATTGNLTAPGGRVEVLGTETVALLEDATIDVSAPTGGGTVLIGGDFQGRGTVPNAKRTYVGDNVTINADAVTNGNGGRVIVWADEVTGFYGNITARGGVESGNGGLVEVSGKSHLIFRGNVNTSAVNGLPGTLLLDPTNIIIADGSGDEARDGTDTFAGNNSGVEGSILSAPLSEIDDTAPTTIYESELEGLSGDTNIILQATNDITLQDLSDDGLNLAAGDGVIALSADADGDGVGDFVMEDDVADTIFTNGRDIAISGASLTIGNIDTSVLVAESGELIETARFVSDSPGVALESISGNISNTEDVDLFQIYLTGEGTFSASTDNPETTLDSQLFLFDADGLGIYANIIKRCPFCPRRATLPAGNDLTPTEPGVYYLGISPVDANPKSSEGEIFPRSLFVVLQGPTGPTGNGGLSPLNGWLEGSDQGSYRINLTGVEAPEANVVESIQPIGNSGSITLNATGNININGLVDSSGNLGDGGAVNITASSVFLTNGARISSGINRGGNGNGGAFAITATEAITLSGQNSQGSSSGIFSEVAREATGNSGGITINTASLSLTDGAQLNASSRFQGVGDAGAITITATDDITLSGESSQGDVSGIFSEVRERAEGNSGGITIDTGSLSLTDGARLSATTFGEGNAGAITITAKDAITLEGESSLRDVSGIFSEVERGAEGNSGGITIDTGSLSLTEGTRLSASTFGEGNAGAIVITATQSVNIEGSDIFSRVGRDAQGTVGGITIDTGSLFLADGALMLSSTQGVGDAGAISITARDAITLSGELSQGLTSGIFSQVNSSAKGTAGGITINTGDLSLTDGAQLSASTFGEGNAGAIAITATDAITLEGENSSRIVNQVNSSAKGTVGGITIDTGSLSLTDGAFLSASTFGEGNAGAIAITTTESVNFEGGGIFSLVGRGTQGKAGGITIETGSLSLAEGAFVRSSTQEVGDAGAIAITATEYVNLEGGEILSQVEPGAKGNSGSITIDTNSLSLTKGATVGTITFAEEGDTGAITITATDAISLEGETNQGVGSGIFSAVGSEGRGNSGGITINTGSISLTDGAQLSASTFGVGKAGAIAITATESVTLSGEDSLGSNTGIFSAVAPGAKGLSEGIRIETASLFLKGGALVDASTFGIGDAGAITITATESVTLSGEDSEGIASGIFSQVVGQEAKGTAVGIRIETGSLSLKDGALVDASTFGIGDAGTIKIIATDTITLAGENSQGFPSGIVSEVKSRADGTAGGIRIETGFLSLRDGGLLSASTFGEGNAAAITITATEAITLSGESNQGFPSSISSRVNPGAEGTAGDITIDTVSLSLRDRALLSASTGGVGDAANIIVNAPQAVLLTDNSKFTVETSSAGQPGNITITTPNLTIGKDAEISATATATSTNTEGGGSINVNAANLDLTGKLGIFAETQGVAPAGTLNIQPDNNQPKLDIQFTDTAIISASTTASGTGGDINLTAPETINITGQGKVAVETTGTGNAGTINITSENLNLAEGVEITASTTGSGNAGNINLDANTINLNQTQINAFTNARGNAGSITVSYQDENADNVTLINSIISTEIRENGEANQPSNITIKTENLNSENSTITASTSGKGNAGNITIPDAQQINLTNSSIIATTSGKGDTGEINLTATEKINLAQESEISSSVETGGEGNSLTVNLSTPELELNQSQINAFTDGIGNAGSINIDHQGNNNNQVKLTNQSQISTEIRDKGEANQPSNITIKTDNLNSENSTITASTSGKGNAGNITIEDGQQINLTNSSIIATTSGEGDTGEINLTATEKINLAQESEISSSVETGGIGDSRQIILNTPQLQLTNNAQISAATAGIGNAGQISIPDTNTLLIDENSTISTAILQGGIAKQPANIIINTNSLTLDKSAEITASADGKGEGGNIIINTTTPLTLNNQARITSALDETGIGKGGNITISAPSLLLDNQSEINASTFGIGEGGFVRLILDRQINLDNASVIATAVEPTAIGIGGQIEIDSQQVKLDNQSQLRASTLGQGDADSITIRANTVELINGSKIRTETDSEFDAGNITLNLKEALFITDKGSGLFANTEVNSTGDGGDINVYSPLINLENQGAIAVSSFGEGTGGNITLETDALTLANQSAITAETLSTDGGNIEITVGGNLVLRQNSQISATAGTAAAGGDGGNIKIDAKFILAFPSENSDITANAFLGNGGNISITAEGLFGIKFRKQLTPLSDITASSEFGLAGNVEINTTEVDPNRASVNLPQTVDTQVVQGCNVDGETAVAFYNLGRGGLPASPDQFLTPDTVIGEWLPLAPSLESFPQPEKLSSEVIYVFREHKKMRRLVPPCWQ